MIVPTRFNEYSIYCTAKVPPWKSLHPDIEQPNPEAEDDGSGAEAAADPAPTAPVPIVNPNLAPPVLWFSRQMNRLAGDGRASPILPDSQRYRSSQCAREPESPSASPVEKQQYLRCHYKSYTINFSYRLNRDLNFEPQSLGLAAQADVHYTTADTNAEWKALVRMVARYTKAETLI
ncbi:hypothetical protein DAPPUDRAFT_251817 [Daphnia pulex]|uniref:Uncharacterized protein n=1 Tax=Daphnia pulex TaxID=6669 RepID=E9H1E7_DAPPU|nr:hypothetical protein DAPPUDRAFT_251817 [Daphnia pulex]|eukprot:EFX74513.1 hypothetical protein DAPPUDRAFT_251817 [Daphnia pulex]